MDSQVWAISHCLQALPAQGSRLLLACSQVCAELLIHLYPSVFTHVTRSALSEICGIG